MRKTDTKFALVKTIGEDVGSGSEGEYVGALDDVGCADGLRVGGRGGRVASDRRGRVGEIVGSSVIGAWVGRGKVGLPVGTLGQGKSPKKGPYRLKGLQGNRSIRMAPRNCRGKR